MNLMKKYGINLYNYGSFMYNEYPHKSIWSDKFTGDDFQQSLRAMFSRPAGRQRMLYVHIPFCRKRCFFCICHTSITQDYQAVKDYLALLYREVDLLRSFFDKNSIRPGFRQIHLGGGSPTILAEAEFDRLMEQLSPIADIKNLDQLSIEIDPREVGQERLKFYHRRGVNRISFGIQDFDPDVQKAINRIQPLEVVEKLLAPEVRQRFEGVNFDILCGLPRQTRESFRRTIKEVIRLSPDRIMLMFLTYSPSVKTHQRAMKRSEFPDVGERMVFFHDALKALTDRGYIRIGVDHFAKPTDSLAEALKNRSMHWNSLGYGPGKSMDMVGLGPGSASNISDIGYSQNVYSIPDYEKAVLSGNFPIYRGYNLNRDDVLRRDIIHQLRSFFTLDTRQIEEKYQIRFEEYFPEEKTLLADFAQDGLLELTGRTITVSESGKDFVSMVCRIFDKYRRMNSYAHK